jgi:hypothetical protein
MKGVSIMEPREPKQELEQTQQPRPDEKKRRFRLVKREEQRFRMDKLEERIAPLSGVTGLHCSGVQTNFTCIATQACTGLCTHPPGHCK